MPAGNRPGPGYGPAPGSGHTAGYGRTAGYGPPAPVADHPKATTAMVLGIVAVAGGMACYLPLLLAPFAWVIGQRTTKEIDASGGRLGGRGMAQAGFVLGIVGTGLLGLAVVVLLVYLGFLVLMFGFVGGSPGTEL